MCGCGWGVGSQVCVGVGGGGESGMCGWWGDDNGQE